MHVKLLSHQDTATRRSVPPQDAGRDPPRARTAPPPRSLLSPTRCPPSTHVGTRAQSSASSRARPRTSCPRLPAGSLCSSAALPPPLRAWGHCCPHPLLGTQGRDGRLRPAGPDHRQAVRSLGPQPHSDRPSPATRRDTPEPTLPGPARQSPGQGRAPVPAARPPSPSSFVPHGFQLPLEQRACCSQQRPGRANKGRQLFCHTKAPFRSKASTSPSLQPGRAAVQGTGSCGIAPLAVHTGRVRAGADARTQSSLKGCADPAPGRAWDNGLRSLVGPPSCSRLEPQLQGKYGAFSDFPGTRRVSGVAQAFVARQAGGTEQPTRAEGLGRLCRRSWQSARPCPAPGTGPSRGPEQPRRSAALAGQGRGPAEAAPAGLEPVPAPRGTGAVPGPSPRLRSHRQACWWESITPAPLELVGSGNEHACLALS